MCHNTCKYKLCLKMFQLILSWAKKQTWGRNKASLNICSAPMVGQEHYNLTLESCSQHSTAGNLWKLFETIHCRAFYTEDIFYSFNIRNLTMFCPFIRIYRLERKKIILLEDASIFSLSIIYLLDNNRSGIWIAPFCPASIVYIYFKMITIAIIAFIKR